MTPKTQNPKEIIVLDHMYNAGHKTTIVEKGRKISEKARALEPNDTMEEFKWKSQEISDFLLALKVFTIHGQVLQSIRCWY